MVAGQPFSQACILLAARLQSGYKTVVPDRQFRPFGAASSQFRVWPMNATSYAEFRTAVGPSAHNGAVQSDERMDQVRELLFGEYQRQSEARMALMEARVRELELAFHRRLDVIEQRVEQLVGKADAEHRAAFDELARGISDLGERVRRYR